MLPFRKMANPYDRLRTQPVQARATATVEHLLAVAATLLDEVGVASFNTNLLAERAGVGVRTVYRYFDDKHAIILCLAERMYQAADDSLSRTLAVLGDANADWREALDEVIDDYFSTMGKTPGWTGIRRALQAVPGLDDIRVASVSKHARWLATALRHRGLALPRKRVQLIATTAFAAGSVLLEPALKGGPRRRKAIAGELKTMIRSYLAEYLD